MVKTGNIWIKRCGGPGFFEKNTFLIGIVMNSLRYKEEW